MDPVITNAEASQAAPSARTAAVRVEYQRRLEARAGRVAAHDRRHAHLAWWRFGIAASGVGLIVWLGRPGLPWLKTAWQRLWRRWLFGLRFRDASCPVRLYRRSIFPRILIQSKGAFADIEILAKANFLGCLFTEVDVSWSPAAGAAQPASVAGDFRRVFNRTDFGPPKLDEPPSGTA